MSVYADVIRYRELFGSLFRRDIRAKYRGSFLGLGWSLLHPLVLMLVFGAAATWYAVARLRRFEVGETT